MNANREYIHVSDAARMSVDVISPEYYNRHLILTGVEKMAVDDLFSMVKEMLNDDITIEYSDEHQAGHYVMTPYSFQPSLGHKLTTNDYVDLGQGLLDCLNEIHSSLDHVQEG